VGTDTFSYQITDGHYESEPATVTVTVEAENQAPVAMTDTVTTAAETSVVVDVLANDTDPEGEALTVTQVSSPTHGTATILADQTIEYTPPPDFNGADQFTYTVSDGEATAQGAVSVTVEAVNDAPIAHADAVTTTAETPVVITPLDNDHDPDGDPLTLTAVGAPAHGQATLHPTTATITYTPTQDLDTVTLPYTDPFSYTISDGAHIVSGTISVTVTASQRTIFLPLVSRE
jgi:large repetitive protein